MDITLFMSVAAGAAAFMIWLNDEGVHPAASLIAALGFAFGAAMAWRIQHVGQVLSLSYLPFVLLFLDRALARRSLRYAFAAGAAAAVLVLGRDQVALLAVYLLIGRVLGTGSTARTARSAYAAPCRRSSSPGSSGRR